MQVKIKRLSPKAVIPKYATPGAACFDIHALIVGEYTKQIVALARPTVFHTGLAFKVPDGHAMLIYSRSGHGFKKDIRLSNCTGILDSDYTGELMVKLASDSPAGEPFIVAHGDRIAQAMIVPVEQCEFIEVDALPETERGDGGFGSSGR